MKLYTNELRAENIRREERDGREFLVAPMTFIKSMRLHKGYVPEKEIKESTPQWNGTPLVDDHPTDESNHPISVNSSKSDVEPFGFTQNSEVAEDGDVKTQGEAWFDVELANNIGGKAKEIIDKLEAGETLSVSSSYNGNRLPSGEYDGETHEKVMGNLSPDHIAVFVDKSGRCSIPDGCMVGSQAANQVLVNAIPDDSVTDEGTDDMGLEFDGLEQDEWPEPSFNAFVEAYADTPDEVSEWGDLTEDERSRITSRSINGDPTADDFEDAVGIPVVNPETDNLNEHAVESALAYSQNEASELLEEHFDRDLSANARSLVQRAMQYVGLNEPAESGEEHNTMSEKTELLVNEHGFDAENLPDEDTECFSQIYERFAGNEEETSEEASTDETSEDNEADASEDNEVMEQLQEMQEQMVTQDDLDDQIGEAIAANKEQNKKSEIVDDIVANSDEYDDDDRDQLMDTPTTVLEDLAANQESGEADFRGVRGATASAGSDASMPALSANSRIEETQESD